MTAQLIQSPQLGWWECPRCGQGHLTEDTGRRIVTRQYGTAAVMRFFRDGVEVQRCTCNGGLHRLYNEPQGLSLRGRR
jgi:hypothetical protein